ncbi:MAG: hypothetical protein ACUVS2_01575 [Candidatus Flexifilum sp.]|jgi:hypothetical protein
MAAMVILGRVEPHPSALVLASTDTLIGSLIARREDEYVILTTTSGPMEITLRLRADELARTLKHPAALSSEQVTARQVGSAHAYLAIGRRDDGDILLRPTLIADATGQLSFNLLVTAHVAGDLLQWLEA